jgi:hypothetical protein
MSAATIACLKITLDDVKPAVLRRIEGPLAIRLDRLHLVIQAAMGWTNSHLYELRAGDVGWGIPEPGWSDGPLDARKARLIDVLEDVGTKTLRYIYDFGDSWEHTIKIERVIDHTGCHLSAFDRPLDAASRGHRLGLCRTPRCDRRSQTRTSRRNQRLDRRRLRPQRRQY